MNSFASVIRVPISPSSPYELSGSIKRTIEMPRSPCGSAARCPAIRGSAFLGPCLFQPEGRQVPDRCGDLEGLVLQAEIPAGRGHGSDRHRAHHHLPRIVEIPDRHRADGPAGAGALVADPEERKRKLGAEGLFDPAAKQLLPYMPRVAGVVTSPTGAVIRDILHRIADPFSRPCARLAGQGAGRGLGRGGGECHPRLQRAGAGGANPPAGGADRRAAVAASRTCGASTTRSWCARGGREQDSRFRRSVTRPTGR